MLGRESVTSMNVSENTGNVQSLMAAVISIIGLGFALTHQMLDNTRGRIVVLLLVSIGFVSTYHVKTTYQSVAAAQIKKDSNLVNEYVSNAKKKQAAALVQARSQFRDARANGAETLDAASKELLAARKIEIEQETAKDKLDSDIRAEQKIIDEYRVKLAEAKARLKPTASGIFGEFVAKVYALFIALLLVLCEYTCAGLIGTLLASFAHVDKALAATGALMPITTQVPDKPIAPSVITNSNNGSGFGYGVGVAAAGIIGAGSGAAMAVQPQKVVLPALSVVAEAARVGVSWREGVQNGIFGKKEGVLYGINSEFSELVADIRARRCATNVEGIRARMKCGDKKGAYWRDRLIAENIIRFAGKGKPYEVVV